MKLKKRPGPTGAVEPVTKMEFIRDKIVVSGNNLKERNILGYFDGGIRVYCVY
jgi:hypothetical protein